MYLACKETLDISVLILALCIMRFLKFNVKMSSLGSILNVPLCWPISGSVIGLKISTSSPMTLRHVMT